MMAERPNDEVWTAGDLLERLERRDRFFVLDVRNRDEFQRFPLEGLPKFIPEYVDIKRVNAGLLTPAEEGAATLELGKNVCALSQAYVLSGGGRK